MNNSVVIDTPEGINFAQLCAIKGALKLEIVGLKRRGQSAYSIAKQKYGLKDTKQSVLDQLQAMIDTTLAQ